VRRPGAVRLRRRYLVHALRSRVRLGAALTDQGIEAGLVQHGDGVAAMHGVALILEQTRQSSPRERCQLQIPDLDGAGHLEHVIVAVTRRRCEQRLAKSVAESRHGETSRKTVAL